MSKGMSNPIVVGAAKQVATGFVAKNWKPILGVTAVGVAGYLVYDKFFKKKIGVQPENNPKFPASELSKFEANKLAEELFDAMKSIGTDEERIKSILQGKTPNDFVKISEAFGLRCYDDSLGIYFICWLSEKLTLHEWLTRELSKEDMDAINKIIL